MKLSGKCGRCGSLIYVEVDESVGEEAETSCTSCGQKLQVRVRGLPDRRKPDAPSPLEESLAVPGVPSNVDGQTEPVLGVRQPVRSLVGRDVPVPAVEPQAGQVLDFDHRQPPEEPR